MTRQSIAKIVGAVAVAAGAFQSGRMLEQGDNRPIVHASGSTKSAWASGLAHK